MPRSVFLDTSLVLALENKDGTFHEKAKQLDRKLTAERCEYLLHWGILLEIADGYARIDRRSKGLKLIERLQTQEGFGIEPITEPLFGQAIALYRSRTDKEWGLTDCLSFTLMRQHKITDALTADLHFRQAGFVALLLEP